MLFCPSTCSGRPEQVFMSMYAVRPARPISRPEIAFSPSPFGESREPYSQIDVTVTLDAIDVALDQNQAVGETSLELVAALPLGSVALTGQEPDNSWIAQEKYALSFRKMERLVERIGSFALQNGVETEESIRLKEVLKDEWKSTLVEMLATDPDFRKALNIRRIRSHDVVGGRVMAEGPDGSEAVVDMIRRGADRSAIEAGRDSRMGFQAKRDQADLRNAQEVDALAPGMLRIVVSMDPKDAFRVHGQKFVEKLGYRQGWGSVQGYFKLPDGKGLQTLTFTFNQSNMSVMRQICNAYGAGIPESVTADDFINYAITIPCDEIGRARDVLGGMCESSYSMQGITDRPKEVDTFLNANHVVDQVFESQYIALALAHYTKAKGDALHVFASEMLNGMQNLNAEARQRLSNLCSRQTIERGDVEILDYLIRYGLVELLRTRLPNLLRGTNSVAETFVIPSNMSIHEFMARSLAQYAKIGIAEGRSYGGCAASLDILKNKVPGDFSPQDAFGGKDESGDKSSWKWKKGVCRVEYCPTRPATTEIGPCDVCRGCQHKFDIGLDPTVLYAKRGMTSHKQNSKKNTTAWFGKRPDTGQ